jgi:superfamily I DNA/RNA helicase
MHITLLQPPVPVEQLEIDLRSLRMQEKYASSKRKLMQEYVTQTPKEQYAEQFAQYFQGERPLIEQNQHMVRQDLTPQQREIVMLKEGIHVIEGPAGCGKTTTLAEHVKYLVNQQVPIDHIMITTCNHSAESHIGEALKELESEGEAAFCTTINAFGAKIFKQFRHTLLKPDRKPYYTQEPRILAEKEEEEELEAINAALERCATLDFTDLRDFWPQGLDIPQFGVAYQSNSVEEERFQVVIHQLRQHGVFPMQPPDKEELTVMIGKQTGSSSIAEFYAVYMVFAQVMAERNLHTFDDQIVFALAILRANPEIAYDYQRYFEHIIVDELQDFSPAKVELLMILCQKRKNIMAFGDIWQEIGFDKNKKGKGEDAKVSAEVVFSRLKEQESCGLTGGHHLTINFRSTQEILDLCSYLRNYSGNTVLRSGTNKHGKKPLYLSTQTNALEDFLNATLAQTEQLSDAEKESIMLIVGNKTMFYEAQRLLERQGIPFSVLDGKTLYQLHYVKNMLLYLSLVLDKTRDEDIERLLRYNIVPYFSSRQINDLKKCASKQAISLFETISAPKYLKEAKIKAEQQERLRSHLEIINRLRPEDLVCQLEQDLTLLRDGPLTLLQEQEEKRKQVGDILSEFSQRTISATVEEIGRHLLFLDTHHRRSDLILSSVDSAKSQECETVFLLGIDSMRGKRLYVSVSRAKRRLFFVGDGAAFAKNTSLSQAPQHLYTTLHSGKAGMVKNDTVQKL